MVETTPRTHLSAGACVAIVAVLAVVLAAALNQYRIYLGQLDGLRDLSDYVVGRDFVNYWLGGRAVLEGRLDALFDAGAHLDRLRSEFWPELPFHNWSYPPHYLFMVAPFGLLDYHAAYAAWFVIGLAVLAATICSMRLPLPPWIVVLALAPVCLVNLLYGQNGLILGSLLAGGLWWRDTRPWLAGVLLGMLTVKPQLGIVVPVLLLLQGNWRTIVMACATSAALIALSGIVFGWPTWHDYVAVVSPLQYQIMTEGIGFFTSMMQSPFRAALALGIAIPGAWVVHGAFALATLGLVARAALTLRHGACRKSATAVTIAATYIVSPYAMSYDMAALVCAALIWIAVAGKRPGPGRGLLAAAAFILPLVGPYLAALELPVGPLVLVALCLAIVHDAKAGRQPVLPSAPPKPRHAPS